MQMDDISYYRSRAEQERIAARASPNGPAREIHDQLADMYRFRVAILAGRGGARSPTMEEHLAEAV